MKWREFRVRVRDSPAEMHSGGERDFCIDNLLVRVHLIIEMMLVDRPCAIGV